MELTLSVSADSPTRGGALVDSSTSHALVCPLTLVRPTSNNPQTSALRSHSSCAAVPPGTERRSGCWNFTPTVLPPPWHSIPVAWVGRLTHNTGGRALFKTDSASLINVDITMPGSFGTGCVHSMFARSGNEALRVLAFFCRITSRDVSVDPDSNNAMCALNLRISFAGSATPPTGGNGTADVASDRNRCKFAKPSDNSVSRATLASCALIKSCFRFLVRSMTRVQSFSDWGNTCLNLGFGKHYLQTGRIRVVLPQQIHGSLETNHTCLCLHDTVVWTASKLMVRRLGTV